MFLKKLALIALVVLYSLTGSVAAFAADGDCAHQPAAPAWALAATSAADPVMDCDCPEHQAERTNTADKCLGLCHLQHIANLDGVIALEPHPKAAQPAVRHHAAALRAYQGGVPTPPPDVVSRLS